MKLKLITPLLIILFTLPSFASDLPPCPKDISQTYDNCFGTYTWSSGSKYVGEYKNDEMHGEGTYTWAGGAKYVGKFKYGERHGAGNFITPDGRVTSAIGADGVRLYTLSHQKGERQAKRFALLRQERNYQRAKREGNAEELYPERYSAEKQRREAQSRREENNVRTSCAMDAGKAGTEYAAKQIEKTCLQEHGLKPKGWFDEYKNAFAKGAVLGIAVAFIVWLKMISRKIRGTILFGRLENKLNTSSFLKNANQNTIQRILVWSSYICAFVLSYTFLGIVAFVFTGYIP